MLAGIVLAACLAGCTSNPFMTNYVGVVQPLEGEPVRMTTKQELRRLGSSRFEIDQKAGMRPDDTQALAAAREVGASAYWWTSRPKYHGTNTAEQQQRMRGRVGNTATGGIATGERALKWFAYEAVFYADRPKAGPGGS